MNWDIRRFDLIDSTNRYLVDEAKAGAPEGVVAVARDQTAGRGRQGRVWDSKPGSSLLFSVLFRPREVVPFRYTQAMSLAVVDACSLVGGFTAKVKWPNDVLVNEKKLAGVLSELVYEGETASALVVGCGINLNWHGELPEPLQDKATSADAEAGHAVDEGAMLDAILKAMNERLARPAWLVDAYRQRCGTLGRTVAVVQGDSETEGVAVDVTDDGSLVLETDSGELTHIRAGDVFHIR